MNFFYFKFLKKLEKV